MKKLSIAAIILASIAIAGEVFVYATQKETSDTTYQKAMQSGYHVYAPILPDTVTFAGEAVPMDIYYVREGLDRELVSMMYWQSNTIFWFKRANRYFPTIERILKEECVPEDFKYLCVIESGLQNLTSPAKAQGYWQFIKTTGQHYGLEVTDEIDMRNDLEASTRAACRFLKTLRNNLGSWTAAAAAYNRGENGIAAAFQKQSVASYYDTRLNTETSRYVYRIIAAKTIMQNPQKYGFYLRRCDLYPALPTRTATFSGQNINLYTFAKQNGTSYKMLRDLNPWLCNDKIVNKNNKTYTVKLPVEKGTLQRVVAKDDNRRTELITHM